ETSVARTIASGAKAGRREPRRAPGWDEEDDAARVEQVHNQKLADHHIREDEFSACDREAEHELKQHERHEHKQRERHKPPPPKPPPLVFADIGAWASREP